MHRTALLGRAEVPVLGQGTWRLGETPEQRSAETAAIRAGVELGMTVIDTAEMYGEGETEAFLGEALVGLRQSVFLVSKVYPQNAGHRRIERACEASLRRLKTDYLDLYLLHWRGAVPLAQTVEGMEALVADGKIAAWGVSNLDLSDMDELARAGGQGCAADQVLYNVARRGVEFDLLPALAKRDIAMMAYSPMEQGGLPAQGALAAVARRHEASLYQIALAWVLRQPRVIAIPKAATVQHVRENRAAGELELTPEDLAEIDAAFPPPTRKSRLEML